MKGNKRKESSAHMKIFGHFVRVFSLLFAIVFAFAVIPRTVAWFADNKKVDADNIDVTPNTTPGISLACKKASDEADNKSYHIWDHLTSSDTRSDIKALYASSYSSGKFVTGAKTSNPDITLLYTGGKNAAEISWWMGSDTCDFKDQEGSKAFIEPCDYGMLTFYVIVNSAQDGEIECNLSLCGYYVDEDGDLSISDGTDTVKVNKFDADSDIHAYLNHHIIFFASREEDAEHILRYSDRISDGKVKIDISDVAEGEAVAVSIYWIWAGYFDQFLECDPPLTTTLCVPGSDDYKSLIGDMNDDPLNYFYTDGTIEIPDDVSDLLTDDARELYNRADSQIGDNVDYVCVNISIN